MTLLLLALAACAPEPKAEDRDGDGVLDAADCAPDDPAVFPGAVEACNGVDDDCDGAVDDGAPTEVWFADVDGDGWGENAAAVAVCGTPEGFAREGGDCAPTDPEVHPGAEETCDGVDQDCDGAVDDDATDARLWYADADGDGWGAGEPTRGCSGEPGEVVTPGDCDDADPLVNPAADEICDPDDRDEDCDGGGDDADPQGAIDGVPWYTDADADGYGATTYRLGCDRREGEVGNDRDCDDSRFDVSPAMPPSCDEALDHDCDGGVDTEDADGDGVAECDDCAEADPTRGGPVTWYLDADRDGYGDATVAVSACAPPEGYVPDPTDCDDGNARTSPGDRERCSTDVDDDCDGAVNEEGARGCDDWFVDGDGDGEGGGEGRCLCEPEPPYDTPGGDCDDDDATVWSGGDEVCADGVDQDCDGDDWCASDELLAAVEGTEPYARLGAALALADVDADGVLDLVTGAPSGAGYVGEAAVFRGPIVVGMGAATASVEGPDAFSAFGKRLWAGDLDGDGAAEVVVAAPDADVGAGYGGAVYLLPGPVVDGPAAARATLTVVGPAASAHLGEGLAAGGDLDGDGVPEVVAGGPWGKWGGWWSVPADRTGTVPADVGPWSVERDAASPGELYAVATGDLDGDGQDDLVVGAEDAGVGGRVAWLAGPLRGAYAWSDADGSWETTDPGLGLGSALVLPGDVDGDGRGDLLVSSEVETWLLTAPAAGAADVADATAAFAGVGLPEGLGGMAAGDLDADGVIDLALGSPEATDDGRGLVVVYTGPFAGRRDRLDADVGWLGDIPQAGLGAALVFGGDLDGDGFGDLLVGVEDTPTAADNQGSVLWVSGADVP